MEFSQFDDSKSSSDETDRSVDRTNDEAGIARSYGCVFCKRGFTTAQALGGHMNIHRKDRAKTRPPSSDYSVPSSIITSNSPIEEMGYPSIQSYFPMPSYPAHYYATPEPHTRDTSDPVYLPASMWGGRPPPQYNRDNCGDIHYYTQNSYLSAQSDSMSQEEEWRWRPNLQVGPSHVVDDNKGKRRQHGAEEDGLDLELRLGHDP